MSSSFFTRVDEINRAIYLRDRRCVGWVAVEQGVCFICELRCAKAHYPSQFIISYTYFSLHCIDDKNTKFS